MTPETTPVTIERLQGRIAELEEELSVSDAGAGKLAQRCLALEKELQALTMTPEEEEETFNVQLLRPTLLFDRGFGYSAQNILEAPEDAYQEDKHTVSALFTLKKNAVALRLDPGELPCYITDVTCSDERLTVTPQNGGLQTGSNAFLFPNNDPQFYLEGRSRFGVGTQLVITYRYYPLKPNDHDPFSTALIEVYNARRMDLMTAERNCAAAEAELNTLRPQLATVTAERDLYKDASEALRASTSWKLTAPLRRLTSMLHKG
jgi:hypothetical protein